jgi:hypothetical protein
MTTLTIDIPDSEIIIVSDFIKKRGGKVLNVDSDDDLTEAEFALLQESYKEALLIKKGMIKAIPLSELWNEK